MRTAFREEFWRDQSLWPPVTKGFEGKQLIFLLEAVHRLGHQLAPTEWPKIKHVYRDPELAAGDNCDQHRLLYRYDPLYKPQPQPRSLFEKYRFSEADEDLIAAIALYAGEVDAEHFRIHQDVLKLLTFEFATGRISTFEWFPLFDSKYLPFYFGGGPEEYDPDPNSGFSRPVGAEKWGAAPEKTERPFVFGQACDRRTLFGDERGDSWVYVDERDFTNFLEAFAGRLDPVTEIEKFLRELDADPARPATWTSAREAVVEALSTRIPGLEARVVGAIGPYLEPPLKNYFKRGPARDDARKPADQALVDDFVEWFRTRDKFGKGGTFSDFLKDRPSRK